MDDGKALLELVASEMAVGNNGGNWATHYTEEQKQVWRNRAKRLLIYIADLPEQVLRQAIDC